MMLTKLVLIVGLVLLHLNCDRSVCYNFPFVCELSGHGRPHTKLEPIAVILSSSIANKFAFFVLEFLLCME